MVECRNARNTRLGPETASFVDVKRLGHPYCGWRFLLFSPVFWRRLFFVVCVLRVDIVASWHRDEIV